MTKEGFIKLVENAESYLKELDRWSSFGIDLYDLPISELSWRFLDLSINELFTEKGVDLINWWIFDKSNPNHQDLEIYDEKGEILPMDTIDDLWNLVKEFQK